MGSPAANTEVSRLCADSTLFGEFRNRTFRDRAYLPAPDRCPSSDLVPPVHGATATARRHGVFGPAVCRSRAPRVAEKTKEGSLTTSIAEPRLQLTHSQQSARPVLRRLVDILAPAAPATVESPLTRTSPEAAPASDPAASVLAERVLRAAVEILGGRRPAHQLSAVLRPDLLNYLGALQVATGHLEPRLRKVLCQQHLTQTVEAVALVTLNTGVRALAARFEKHGNRWQCTALQLRLTAGDVTARRGRRTART